MRKNHWLSYFLYSVILISYIFFSNKMLVIQAEQRSNTFEFLPYLLWSTVIFVVLGALLGLEKFILERRKEGHWEVNLPKAIFLGIPLLYLAFGFFLNYCPLEFVNQTLTYPLRFFLMSDSNFLAIFQIIFGYVVVTSFDKVEYHVR